MKQARSDERACDECESVRGERERFLPSLPPSALLHTLPPVAARVSICSTSLAQTSGASRRRCSGETVHDSVVVACHT